MLFVNLFTDILRLTLLFNLGVSDDVFLFSVVYLFAQTIAIKLKRFVRSLF